MNNGLKFLFLTNVSQFSLVGNINMIILDRRLADFFKSINNQMTAVTEIVSDDDVMT